MRIGTIGIAGLALLAACAVMEAPSGGPEDKIPPRIVASFPHPDSTGVARDVRPAFTFDENIDGESFKSRVLVFPRVEFDRISAKGERLEIRFKTLLPETTICLMLMPGYRDAHRSPPSPHAHVLVFSTTDSLEDGRIEGAVFFKEKPDSAGAAELFAVRADSLTDLRTTKRARVAFAGPDGRFSMHALPAGGNRFLLRGFIDKDGDGYFSEGKEFGLIYPDTIVLGRFAPFAEDINIMVIDPNEPGAVDGTVVNETALAAAPTVRLSPVTAGEKALAARADTTGRFTIGRVPPGRYVVSAFIDMRADSLCGSYPDPADSTTTLEEPCVTLPDTLHLKPGEMRTLDPITITGREAR